LALFVTTKSGYLPTLDGWRAVAIILVLVGHHSHAPEHAAAQSALADQMLALFRDSGYFGVRIFFGISGFLICTRLIEEYRKNGRISLFGFYVRRFFRIIPPLATLLLTLLALAQVGAIKFQFGQWLACLFFAANYISISTWYGGHLWSLAVEEHFYFVFPGLLILVGVSRGLKLAVVLAIAIIIWRAVAFKLIPFWDPLPGAQFWFRTDIVADGLMWGCATAFVCDSPRRQRLLKLLNPIVFYFLLAFTFATMPFRLLWPEPKLSMFIYTLQAFIIPLLIARTVFGARGAASRVLEWRPLRQLGKLSYSIYLWQQLFTPPSPSPQTGLATLQQFPLNLVMIMTASLLSYYFIEKPMIRLGHRLARPTTPGREDVKI
jgi:peptidoglycan/LPS O-acetylase OafA/YrhL